MFQRLRIQQILPYGLIVLAAFLCELHTRRRISAVLMPLGQAFG